MFVVVVGVVVVVVVVRACVRACVRVCVYCSIGDNGNLSYNNYVFFLVC